MRRSTTVILIISIVIVGLVTFIFYNSLEEQEKSADKSTGVLSFIINVFNLDCDQEGVNKLHKALRKTAHVLEFTALGVLLSMFFRKFERRNGRKYIAFPLFIGLLVGVLDEYIQSFNDRSSEVMDILIDFGGAATGLFVTMLVFYLLDKRRRARRRRRLYEYEENYGS